MGQTHKQILPWYVCIKVDSSGYYLKKYLYSYYTILCTLFCMYGIIIWFPIRYYNLLAILRTLFCDGVLWRLLLFHLFGCYTFDYLFTWRCVWKYLFGLSEPLCSHAIASCCCAWCVGLSHIIHQSDVCIVKTMHNLYMIKTIWIGASNVHSWYLAGHHYHLKTLDTMIQKS